MSSQSQVKELEDSRAIRTCCNPIVYHEDFNPFHSDCLCTQLMFVPELICDTVKFETNHDIQNIILYAEQAIENVTIQSPGSPYVPLLWSYLTNFHKEQQQPKLGLQRTHPEVSCVFPIPY